MIESRDDAKKIGAAWMARIRASEQREKAWMDDAEKAECAYLVDEQGEGRTPEFNILHSNVETIVPSIYNSTPNPDIRSRHQNKDEMAKMGATLIERVIATMIDDNRLDTEIEQAAQDVFVAGRGIVRIKFDSDMTEDGMPINEVVRFENVSWRDFRMGAASRWENVDWVAFLHRVSEDEVERLKDPEIAKHYDDKEDSTEDEKLDGRVWEIWCKEKREVLFMLEADERILSIKPDPYQLDDFFPMPEPIQPITGTGRMTPVCPYSVYRKQAEELDRITKRINKLIATLKVRGVIAADAQGIEELASADDGEIKTVGNIENLVAAGGIDKAIAWWPIDRIIAVLRELYVQRDQVKQTIYEITGISDIVRGASQASETATAQQIKTQWGSLRIKKMQRMVERHIRDLFQLSAEMIAEMFSDQGIMQAAGMQVDPQVLQLIRQPNAWYRIDVETDSTIRADLTKSRQEMSEYLQATGQFFNTMAPVVAQAPETAGPMVEVYAAFARQFNLGAAAEEALDQFAEIAKKAASQPKPNPEAEKMKAEMQQKAQEMQMQAVSKVKDREFQAQIEAAKLEVQRQRDEKEAALEREKFEWQKLVDVAQYDIEAERAEMELGKERLVFEENEQEVTAIAAKTILPVLQQMQEENRAANAALAASVEAFKGEVSGALAQMAEAMTAGSDIVRENGRVVGSRSRYQGQAEGMAAPVIQAITREKRLNGDMVN